VISSPGLNVGTADVPMGIYQDNISHFYKAKEDRHIKIILFSLFYVSF